VLLTLLRSSFACQRLLPVKTRDLAGAAALGGLSTASASSRSGNT